MSKRKGVSAEDKRKRVLEIFHEKKDFFQLKELEKIAPKEKGVIAQSVKEVVQSLVDDGLVDSDKIGTSIYYWSYPSKAHQTKKRKVEELKNEYEEEMVKLKKINENIEVLKVGREDTEERRNLMENVKKLEAEKQKLQAELQKLKDNDPEELENKKKEIQVKLEAANKWTDNIFTIRSWCKNKFMIEESAIDKQFGIPDDFDYIE